MMGAAQPSLSLNWPQPPIAHLKCIALLLRLCYDTLLTGLAPFVGWANYSNCQTALSLQRTGKTYTFDIAMRMARLLTLSPWV
jgi:hypothetical protein